MSFCSSDTTDNSLFALVFKFSKLSSLRTALACRISRPRDLGIDRKRRHVALRFLHLDLPISALNCGAPLHAMQSLFSENSRKK